MERPLAEFPTNTLAGSPERIEVYRERWSAGYSLWHPADNSHVLNEYETRLAPVSGIRVIAMPKLRDSHSDALS